MKRFLYLFLIVLPFSAFPKDSLLYIVNQGDNQVEIYNLSQDFFEPPLTYVNFDLGYGNVQFSNDLTKIYIINYDGNFVSVFDAATRAHLGDFGSAPDLNEPEELAFSEDGSKLYISNYGATNEQCVSVFNIDPITGLGVFSNHFGGSVANPTTDTAGLALDGDRERLYLISATTPSKVSVFDLATETLIGEFTNPSASESYGCFYNGLENALYLPNYTTNDISVFTIDPTTGLGTFARTIGSNLLGPEDLTFSQDLNSIYVGNDADFITELDRNGNFIRQINAPLASALLTGLGGNFLYVNPSFIFASANLTFNRYFCGSCYYNLVFCSFTHPDVILRYEIYKRIDGNFVLVKTILPGEPLEYFDKDIKLDQTYEYKIVAISPDTFFEKIVFSN